MKRPSVLALAVALSLAGTPVARAADQTVVVPEGTLILTHLADDMSSKNVHTGDIFEFVVDKDITVDGLLAIKSGAKGVGHVTEAHSGGRTANPAESASRSTTFSPRTAIKYQSLTIKRQRNTTARPWALPPSA
jgi:hypothetical protein